MKRATSTRPPTAHIAPFGLRLQNDLRAKLEAAATESGRSLNAEITERLIASFGEGPSVTPLMSAAIAEALGDVMEYAHEHGVTPDEALAGLVVAALNQEAQPVYFFVIDKDMKMAQLREMFAATKEYFPEDATVHVQARDMERNPPAEKMVAAPKGEPDESEPAKKTVKRIYRTKPH
ncbi:Arc family DNA-binding protein [Cupriavidus necator]|uniref:Arc family DNA-binding protein n=1 Tax=Cupriavidus necator TaxID=106590 RepID=UPI003ED0C71C